MLMTLVVDDRSCAGRVQGAVLLMSAGGGGSTQVKVTEDKAELEPKVPKEPWAGAEAEVVPIWQMFG